MANECACMAWQDQIRKINAPIELSQIRAGRSLPDGHFIAWHYCPWCGAPLGPAESGDAADRARLYEIANHLEDQHDLEYATTLREIASGASFESWTATRDSDSSDSSPEIPPSASPDEPYEFPHRFVVREDRQARDARLWKLARHTSEDGSGPEFTFSHAVDLDSLLSEVSESRSANSASSQETPRALVSAPTGAVFPAFLCPNCHGAKHVTRPPHVAGDATEWTDSGTGSYPCPTCNASGVVWRAEEPREIPTASEPPNDEPLSERLTVLERLRAEADASSPSGEVPEEPADVELTRGRHAPSAVCAECTRLRGVLFFLADMIRNGSPWDNACVVAFASALQPPPKDDPDCFYCGNPMSMHPMRWDGNGTVTTPLICSGEAPFGMGAPEPSRGG